jgi:hypothetical protein
MGRFWPKKAEIAVFESLGTGGHMEKALRALFFEKHAISLWPKGFQPCVCK